MTVGKRIKAARKAANGGKGMTQQELADALGFNYTLVSQYERGIITPKDEQLKRIATALGVDDYYLRTGETLEERYWRFAESGKAVQIGPGDPEWEPNREAAYRDRLLDHFDALNFDGQTRAVEAVGELTEIPRYRKDQKDGDPE